MKITFFSCHSYIQPFLEKKSIADLELIFLETTLNDKTVELAEGSSAVSVFSKDDVSAPILQRLQQLGVGLICLRSAGYNNVDLATAQQLGIKVARVPAYSPHAIAEHTIALILALSRKFIQSNQRVKNYNFSLDGLTGFNLGEKIVGIIGTGKIGAATIQMLHGFGSQILAYDINPNPILREQFGVQYTTLNQLIKQSDIISLHVPLLAATEYLINAQRISQMKRGVLIINTGRGKLLDTKAAIAALKTGHIGALGLDVYENEKPYFFEDHSDEIMQDDTLARLMTFPNVLLTGHQAFLTETALSNIADTTIENILAFKKAAFNDNFLV